MTQEYSKEQYNALITKIEKQEALFEDIVKRSTECGNSIDKAFIEHYNDILAELASCGKSINRLYTECKEITGYDSTKIEFPFSEKEVDDYIEEGFAISLLNHLVSNSEINSNKNDGRIYDIYSIDEDTNTYYRNGLEIDIADFKQSEMCKIRAQQMLYADYITLECDEGTRKGADAESRIYDLEYRCNKAKEEVTGRLDHLKGSLFEKEKLLQQVPPIGLNAIVRYIIKNNKNITNKEIACLIAIARNSKIHNSKSNEKTFHIIMEAIPEEYKCNYNYNSIKNYNSDFKTMKHEKDRELYDKLFNELCNSSIL